MSVGETAQVKLGRETPAVIKLISFHEQTAPFLERDGKFVDAVVSADVELEINGTPQTLTGGLYHLPETIGDLAILVGRTRGLTGGIFTDDLKKDMRLEVNDAGAP